MLSNSSCALVDVCAVSELFVGCPSASMALHAATSVSDLLWVTKLQARHCMLQLVCGVCRYCSPAEYLAAAREAHQKREEVGACNFHVVWLTCTLLVSQLCRS